MRLDPALRPQPVVDALLWVLVAAALVFGSISGGYRAITDQPDYSEFNREADYVWQHGHTRPGTAMFGYLPTTTFLLWPFTTWTPDTVGAVAWTTLNTLAIVLSAVLVYRWWLRDPPPFAMYALPLALAAPNLAHAIQSNQMTALTLLLMVAGVPLVEGRGPYRGGFLLGAAAAIKTVPLLLAGYLLLRGKWRALAAMGGAIVLLDVVPSVAYFGPQQALAEHRAWLRRAEWHSSWRQIKEPFLRVHRHGTNSSPSAVLTRWLREPPDTTRQIVLYGDPPRDVIERYRTTLPPNTLLTIDPMPRTRRPDGEWPYRVIEDLRWVPRIHVADLPAEVVYAIWLVIVGMPLLGLAIATAWRTRTSHDDWAPVAALWLLALLWPSPMTRHYYLAWASPALVVVWHALVWAGVQQRGRWSAGMCVGAIGLLGWLMGDVFLGSKLVRWYGIHLLSIVLLAGATGWAWRRPPTRAAAASRSPEPSAASIMPE